jgi:hypothetical protein
MNWENLWYIRLVPGGKKPMMPYGGFDQDFENADNVLSHDEVMNDDHPRYGYIAHQSSKQLGILDLDLDKPEALPANDLTARSDLPIIKTQSGGLHIPFLVPADTEPLRVTPRYDSWIDLKGEVNSQPPTATRLPVTVILSSLPTTKTSPKQIDRSSRAARRREHQERTPGRTSARCTRFYTKKTAQKTSESSTRITVLRPAATSWSTKEPKRSSAGLTDSRVPSGICSTC